MIILATTSTQALMTFTLTTTAALADTVIRTSIITLALVVIGSLWTFQ